MPEFHLGTIMLRPLIFLTLLSSSTLGMAGDIQLSSPINGWHNSATENQAFMQEVNYPASSVNTRDYTATGSLIRGQITNTPKNGKQKPLTLVVNGVAMPQRVDEGGQFSRPYSFGPGSNSVEMRDDNGNARRIQYYESYSGRAKSRIRVVLSWDTDGTDLDLHLITPKGEHIWYGKRQGDDGSALDIDVTTGYGPEIISSPSPQSGTYLIYVNYYGQGDNPKDSLTVAKVAVITDEGTPKEKVQNFMTPMRSAGDLTLVRAFTYP